jgi:hypothetical protein
VVSGRLWFPGMNGGAVHDWGTRFLWWCGSGLRAGCGQVWFPGINGGAVHDWGTRFLWWRGDSGETAAAGEGYPACGEQGDERDDGLGADAVEAPDLEQVVLDVGEVEGVGEAEDGAYEQEFAESKRCEDHEQRIAEDADEGDGYAVDHGEVAVVDDAAVPVGVDVAGLAVGDVVDPQGERRYDNTQGRENGEQDAHGWGGFSGSGIVCRRTATVYSPFTPTGADGECVEARCAMRCAMKERCR